MENHDHPLIKMIRLSDEEKKAFYHTNAILPNDIKLIENVVLSKLTALMTDGLPSDDEIEKLVPERFRRNDGSRDTFSDRWIEGAKDIRDQASLLLAKERAEMEEWESDCRKEAELNIDLQEEITILTAKIEGMEKEIKESFQRGVDSGNEERVRLEEDYAELKQEKESYKGLYLNEKEDCDAIEKECDELKANIYFLNRNTT